MSKWKHLHANCDIFQTVGEWKSPGCRVSAALAVRCGNAVLMFDNGLHRSCHPGWRRCSSEKGRFRWIVSNPAADRRFEGEDVAREKRGTTCWDQRTTKSHKFAAESENKRHILSNKLVLLRIPSVLPAIVNPEKPPPSQRYEDDVYLFANNFKSLLFLLLFNFDVSSSFLLRNLRRTKFVSSCSLPVNQTL